MERLRRTRIMSRERIATGIRVWSKALSKKVITERLVKAAESNYDLRKRNLGLRLRNKYAKVELQKTTWFRIKALFEKWFLAVWEFAIKVR